MKRFDFTNTIFFKVFLGIVLTSFLVLSTTETIHYLRALETFKYYAINGGVELSIEYADRLLMAAFISFSIGLLMSIILGNVITTFLTRPIYKLKSTIQSVKQSNYKVRAIPSGAEELRELISDFNSLIQELDDQDKLREEMISDISHELKTPITKIRGILESIMAGVYENSAENHEKLLANVEQLEYLIDKLYKLNKLNRRDTNLNLEDVNVKMLVEQSVSGFKGKDIKFHIKIPTELQIKADKNKLIEVLDNIISNAYKYTEKGKITISADPSKLLVKDTGVGIPEDEIQKVFERFYRVEKSRNRDKGGLGLGLYIVKKIADLHHWKIEIRSKLSKGSTFTIYWGDLTK